MVRVNIRIAAQVARTANQVVKILVLTVQAMADAVYFSDESNDHHIKGLRKVMTELPVFKGSFTKGGLKNEYK